MEVFKWNPLLGSNESIDEKIKEIQFGDGYEQVSPDGLNSKRRVFTGLVFGSCDSEKAKAIKEFYLRHGRSKAFRLETTEYNAIVRFNGTYSETKKGALKDIMLSMKEVVR